MVDSRSGYNIAASRQTEVETGAVAKRKGAGIRPGTQGILIDEGSPDRGKKKKIGNKSVNRWFEIEKYNKQRNQYGG